MRDFTTPDQVEAVYGGLARRYDLAARLLDLLGFGYDRLRLDAVNALHLKEGDRVLEIGCGTGANFPLLEDRIGATGRIVGLDLTREMLDVAARRITDGGWSNVELIHCRASEYAFPDQGFDAVVSTLALTLEPDYDAVVGAAAKTLRPGGRFVIADLKLPKGWVLVALPVLLPIVRPFAVSLKLAGRRPWASMERHFGAPPEMREFWGGYLYVAAATRRL